MKTSALIVFLLLAFCSPLLSQPYTKVTFNKDTFYTFSVDFFDTTFRKPDTIPDGEWIILSKDSVPIFFFNVKNGNIDGPFSKFQNGHIKKKGFYRNDSLWTFRFNENDVRFKDSVWLIYFYVGSQYIWQEKYNEWYPSGKKKYEKHGDYFGDHVEFWYYPSGAVEKSKTVIQFNKYELMFEQFFTPTGQVEKFISTKFKLKGKSWSKGKYFTLSETIEFEKGRKIREIIQTNRFIKTIHYDSLGKEVNQTKEKL